MDVVVVESVTLDGVMQARGARTRMSAAGSRTAGGRFRTTIP